MSELLFIVGAQKTATSTLLGILNCHPEILLLYEAFNNHPKKKSFYDYRYIKEIPELEPIFTNKKNTISDCYKLSERKICNNKYTYFGGKLVGLNLKTDILASHKIIYTIRDIRTWIMKDSINSMYRVRKNTKTFTNTSLLYTIRFINTFKYKKCIRLSTEDVVCNIQNTIQKIEDFLKIDLSEYTSEWQNKIGKYDDKYKIICPDWDKHPSSLLNEGKLDVQLEYNDNTSWKHILNIFDKYYNSLDKQFSDKEINNDIASLKRTYSKKNMYIGYSSVYPDLQILE